MRVMATAAFAALLLAAGCAPSADREAFAAAKAAVQATAGAPAGARFHDLALHDVTGLKGSKAQVVCGSAADAKGTDDMPFIYVWKLGAAVSDPGIHSGEVMLATGALDRRAANRLNHFCTGDTSGSAANPYDYFQ